jgi:hypothetical protein
MPMIPAVLLIISTIAFRIITGLAIISGTGWISNFAPLAAMALCGAAYLPRRYAFAIPMAALLVSDVVLNTHYGFPFLNPFVLSHYLAFALIGGLGMLLRDRAELKTLLSASIAASLIFYFVTNCVSWVFDPGYIKTFAGFIQAQTVGLPVYGGTTPSWMFLRNSLLSDLFFTALFVACMSFGRSSVRATASEPLPRNA